MDVREVAEIFVLSAGRRSSREGGGFGSGTSSSAVLTGLHKWSDVVSIFAEDTSERSPYVSPLQKTSTAVLSANVLIQHLMDISTTPARLRVSTLVPQATLKPNIHIQSAKPVRAMRPRRHLPQPLSLGRDLLHVRVFRQTFMTTTMT